MMGAANAHLTATGFPRAFNCTISRWIVSDATAEPPGTYEQHHSEVLRTAISGTGLRSCVQMTGPLEAIQVTIKHCWWWAALS